MPKNNNRQGRIDEEFRKELEMSINKLWTKRT